MKKLVNILSFFMLSFECCIQHSQWNDDRLCKDPENDVVLEELIDCCKKFELQHILPEMDTSTFFVSFNIFSQNDTDKVWVMGDFANPVFFHDSTQWGMENFLGCFKRENTYCFVYKCIFSHRKAIKESSHAVSFFLKDWNLRGPNENPEFFPKDVSGTIRDPYIYEYMIDSIGNCTLLRKGHW